ncbi:putative protein TPRXL isoform X2 [Fopius arisanus]|uniref:Protein quiver n=1 Tax=Fopius arisanus TaxID=64838 RepID=A0A9R1TSU2_9HYME|nr:PREDICTED: putative protein TPRXL isoform X2 [Fopius arisanus]
MIASKTVILVLFAFVFIAELKLGESLQCIVCKSTVNGKCTSDPDAFKAIECPATTAPPVTESTTSSSPSPSIPSSTPSSTLSPSESSTDSSSSPSSPSSTDSSTSPSSPSSTDSSTLSSSPSSTDSSTSSSSPSSTDSSTSPPSTSNSTSPTMLPSDPTSPPSAESDIEGRQLNSRFKRWAELRTEKTRECYKIIYKEKETEVVERGCVPPASQGCTDLRTGKNGVTYCGTCDRDACNSSSIITHSLTSMLLLLGVTFYLTR